MNDAAAPYLASAIRSKDAWDRSFQKSDEGGSLSPRDLVEMHGAALGLVWATHTVDLDAALAVLHRVETAAVPAPETRAEAVDGKGDERFRETATRVLEARSTGS
jgi:hypothetical protein